MTDGELLERYAGKGSDEAFAAIIERYVRLVYGACWRQLKDQHLAEDATQAVFILLSQKARGGAGLRGDRISGWLLTAARYACANIRKTERRRQFHEQVVAMQMSRVAQNEEAAVAGMLDEALGHLSAADREAVVLRYLREQSLKEVGAQMGLSEEAARKRVERATGKLRDYFVRRGIVTTGAALAKLLPVQGQAVPLGVEAQAMLAGKILSGVHAGVGSSASVMAIVKGTHFMMWTQSMKTAAVAVFLVAVLALAGVWGTWALTRPAQAGTNVAAKGPTFQVDLTTPEKTLESYCRALAIGDRAAAYACTTIDPNRPTTTSDAFMSLSLGQSHLIRAAEKAYSVTDEQVRQFPGVEQVLERILAYDRSRGQAAVIEGDVATLPFSLPEQALAKFPPEVQTQIRAFEDHPIRFKKAGKEWKFGPSEARVRITLKDVQGNVIDDPQLGIKVLTEYGTIYDQVASDIESGMYTSWDDANIGLQAARKDLHVRNGLSDIDVQLTPPTTQAAGTQK